MQNEVSTGDKTITKVLGRMIALCWIVLLACFVIKIFGGNFFAVVYQSKTYERIASNKVILRCIQLPLYFYTTYLLMLMIYGNKHKLLCIPLVLVMFFSRFLPDPTYWIVEWGVLLILPIFLKVKWYKPILCYCTVIIFQLVSMVTKNIGCLDFPSDSIIGIILLIDYYILCTLFYLYYLKGGFKNMGIAFFKWLSKDVAKYEALKKANLEKIKKHQDIVADIETENKLIDAKIADLKAKAGK